MLGLFHAQLQPFWIDFVSAHDAVQWIVGEQVHENQAFDSRTLARLNLRPWPKLAVGIHVHVA